MSSKKIGRRKFIKGASTAVLGLATAPLMNLNLSFAETEKQVQNNPFASVTGQTKITEDACAFIEQARFGDIPPEALRIGARCLLDGLGLFVAGSDQKSVRILAKVALDSGGRKEALVLGHGEARAPAPVAARILGTAGHAHDWDDTQVSLDPNHVYGLLTHPTIPPLSSALALSQKLGNISGQNFMLAFQTGFEVETKISEWMLPQHYARGFHSSGTVGTLGAYAASAKLMGLRGDTLRNGFGVAASLASGIRINFGTMTKPLHVGRASENGITAAILANEGFTADPASLDGMWGFCAVLGGGVSAEKLSQGFGKTWSIVNPGVSIKPYPCGVLTHPTIDLMVKLMRENSVRFEQIQRVVVRAGSNILNPIRYPVAKNHLQAKFSLPAVLAMVAVNGKAGKVEFSDEFVASDKMQTMQKMIETRFDPEIEALGFDKMRSSIEITLENGKVIEGSADERYRGGPENPLSDKELEEKVHSCCEGVLDEKAVQLLMDKAWNVVKLKDVSILAELLQAGPA
jgi:2-methylcitrate dehydratase PrpD